MADTTGELLGGRYEVGEPLGYGGMAEVFAGRDVRLGREVAIKVLRPDLARDPAFLSRFRREAQSAASLSHPAIVSVYDTGDEGTAQSSPFIVMEYVDGRTLREVLREEGRLLPRRAIEITADVCTALEYSHRAGIVHRDIKPGNVMLTRSGEVKVMDFGIARAVTASASTVTQTATVIGTAQYLSPEQARGDHVDARSDVYSTGCLLYELLSGRPPFVGDSPVSVAYQHVREDATPPSRFDPEITPAMDAVVLKALAKNPDNRYASAGEFGADLRRLAAGQAVAAPLVQARDERTRALRAPVPVDVGVPTGATTLPEPPPRRTEGNRHRLVYALLVLAVLVVFAISALVARSALSQHSTGTAAVPQLTGLTKDQAVATLRQAGLQPGAILEKSSDTIPVGQVFDPTIIAGIKVTTDKTVGFSVSAGALMVTVPHGIVGQSKSTAEKNLHAVTIGVAPPTFVTDLTKAPGTVVAVTPPEGTVVRHNFVVTLTIVNTSTSVPPLFGMTEEQAAKALQAADLVLGSVFSAASDSPPGTVISSNPSTSVTGVQRGQSVSIVLAMPRPTPSPTPPPTDTPPPASSSASAPPTGGPPAGAPAPPAPPAPSPTP